MAEPWFDPAYYSWIPGTALGCLAGLWGGLVGFLAPKGKAKPFIIGSLVVLLVVSVCLLILGIVALASGQPYGVWYGFGLAGLIGVIVLGANAPTVIMAYRRAEARKISAQDSL
jgi:uncharacterized membrane protein